MSLRKTNLVQNEFYHIYNRGNGKSQIFLDDEDYERFTKLLYIANSELKFNFRNSIVRNNIDSFDFERGETLVNVLAWVLMPNHFHIILISPRSDLGEKFNPITEFIRKVSTSYSMYFNKKYGRTGSLFEGKFKSNHVGEENYFNYLFSYVHLNPVKLIQKDWKINGINDKNKTIDYLKKYKYSSFFDYFVDSRKYSKIIDRQILPDHIRVNHTRELFDFFENYSI
ncbi:MAG: transposase [Candidatus Nomurabacteria bacterium]|nr:transposase [Candidatus Nomurabacteria bacterium]